MKMKDRESLILEDFSNFAHEQWSGWMEYLFSKSIKKPNGTVVIPKWAVDRWEHQMSTKYKDLREDEKNSDRREASKMIELVKKWYE